MVWYHHVAYFFGGLFLANAIPHWVAGVQGQPFRTPFADPPGVGLSSPTVNVLWAAFNVVAGYLLICQVGAFDLRNVGHVAVAGLPAVAGSLFLARPRTRTAGAR